jgi:uncharacterized protein YfeS
MKMPVSLSIQIVTCRSIGGGPHSLVIGNLLNRPQPDFGAAITEVAVELNRRAPSLFGKPLTADENIDSTVLVKLPRRRFEAKKARYTIVAVSRLPGHEPLVPTGPDNPINIEAFMNAFLAGEAGRKTEFIRQRDDANALRAEFDDVVAALETSPPKLKPGEFNWVSFVDWFRTLKSDLPEAPAAIEAAVQSGAAVAQARLDAMDPWARLDIDWKTFHRDARKLLPDPWFWDGSEDFAPNGNDDGSDVLTFMQKRKKAADFTPTAFDRLIAEFEFDPAGDPEALEDYLQNHYFNLVVGITFAHVKLQGFCPVWLRDMALATMALETKIIHRDHPTWDHKDAKLAALERLTAALNACPSVAP